MTQPRTAYQRERRAAAMRRLRESGWTLQAIADRYGVTRQRVHQILGNTGRVSARYRNRSATGRAAS